MSNEASVFDFAAVPLRRRWKWLLTFGIIEILGGLAAIVVPIIGSLVALAFFGAILIVSAIFHIIHAVQVRRWSGFFWHMLGGVIYGAAGVIIVLYPLDGIAALMLVLGVLFIVDGAIRIVLAAGLRPLDGWGWFFAGGVASIVLGTLLLVMWPQAAPWVVGTLFGINLIFSGLMSTILALSYRSGSVPMSAERAPA